MAGGTRTRLAGLVAVAACVAGLALASGAAAAESAIAPGPPFPDPEVDRAVYDQANVLSTPAEAQAEQMIDAIEERTGAEVVVYTQLVHYGITEEEAETHARGLMDQWGVGRKGFDDGLVILLDVDPSLEHGQVQLYAGPGYRAAFLSNQERDAIFEDRMTPLLAEGDLDGAVLVALREVDANATPEHAARLQAARQVDAVAGLVGAPVVFLLLSGWVTARWWRYGRDPVHLDSPSIHMPAPPPEMSAAAAVVVREGRSSRRALTTALLDLASRGLLSFREERAMLGLRRKVGIETVVPDADRVTEAHRARNGRRPITRAEQSALGRLRSLATDGYLAPDELLKFGPSVATFDERLEDHVVAQGWFGERPARTVQRWQIRAFFVLLLGGALVVIGLNLPSNGVLLIGAASLAGGLVMVWVARSMPAVTLPGAMARAWLSAYRRTLEKTMAQARSMQQVVDDAQLGWLETPDQAVVWGLALGLEDEVEAVLERTLDDVRSGAAAASSYVPSWYNAGGAGSSSGTRGGPGGSGLFSSGSLPNFGGMMGALGTIGNSPSSSGSGGGFGGGGSGGGGGGSGGGF